MALLLCSCLLQVDVQHLVIMLNISLFHTLSHSSHTSVNWTLSGTSMSQAASKLRQELNMALESDRKSWPQLNFLKTGLTSFAMTTTRLNCSISCQQALLQIMLLVTRSLLLMTAIMLYLVSLKWMLHLIHVLMNKLILECLVYEATPQSSVTRLWHFSAETIMTCDALVIRQG